MKNWLKNTIKLVSKFQMKFFVIEYPFNCFYSFLLSFTNFCLTKSLSHSIHSITSFQSFSTYTQVIFIEWLQPICNYYLLRCQIMLHFMWTCGAFHSLKPVEIFSINLSPKHEHNYSSLLSNFNKLSFIFFCLFFFEKTFFSRANIHNFFFNYNFHARRIIGRNTSLKGRFNDSNFQFLMFQIIIRCLIPSAIDAT
jgi:hypothetical protein